MSDEFLDGVLDEVGVAPVDETVGEPTNDAGELLGLSEQKNAAAGGDVAAVEIGDNLPRAESGEVEGERLYSVFIGLPLFGVTGRC